jgi:phosphohistidine phosphatase
MQHALREIVSTSLCKLSFVHSVNTIINTAIMKTLLIIRHAKSSWGLASLNDFDRPLNERGKKDAPVMAQRMLDRKIVPEAFIASPAKRAKKTAELFCNTYHKPINDIVFVSALYHAGVEVFFEVTEQLSDELNCVAIFSHNPGITEFVNELTDYKIDNMPTCSIFAVTVNTAKWKDFKKAKKEFLLFDFPKEHN